MDTDADCLEYQANDEFVFYSGEVVTESNANMKYSQRSKVSNLKPIPTTLTTLGTQSDLEPPTIVGSARSVSPALPQEVIELLPVGLRSLSPCHGRMAKKSFHKGHSRKLSHNYDYLHDLVTCDAIQVLSSRPSPLPLITRSALSSVHDGYRSNSDSVCSGERSGDSSTTNSLNSTSAMSVDSSNNSAASYQYELYNHNDECIVPHEFDDYDNFVNSVDNSNNHISYEPPMGIYTIDNDYSENRLHSNLNNLPKDISAPNDNGDSSDHRLHVNNDYSFSTENDDLILRECKDFINDNAPDLLCDDSSELQISTDEEDRPKRYYSPQFYDEFNCNSIYDNVEFSNKNPRGDLVLSTKLSPQPSGRPPCSPLKGRRSPSPRRRVDSSSLRRRDIPRRAMKHKTPKTNSVHENRMGENVFSQNQRDLNVSVPNDGDTKKEKNKNKSIYHYVKKLLA